MLTTSGYRKVLLKHNNGLKRVYQYQIQLDDISINMCCTSDHKIKTTQGWIQISELQSGTGIFLNRDFLKKHTGYIPERDISQEQEKECTLQYGNTFTVKYLKHILFTTRTKIRGIIELIISKSKSALIIASYTVNYALKGIKIGLINFTLPALPLPCNGINQTRVNNGIVSMLLNNGKIKNTKHLYVRSVGWSTRQNTAENQNTVIQIVKRLHCEEKGLQQVYDLTVDQEHEYFANGILVHNCIDAARYFFQENATIKTPQQWHA